HEVAAGARPAVSRAEEPRRREKEALLRRLVRYVRQPPSPVLGEVSPVTSATAGVVRRWLRPAVLLVLACVLVSILYLAVRFTSDQPVDYPDEVTHFKRGSTGGERVSGFPYWIWVALPELFPEYLPDKKPGRRYTSFAI